MKIKEIGPNGSPNIPRRRIRCQTSSDDYHAPCRRQLGGHLSDATAPATDSNVECNETLDKFKDDAGEALAHGRLLKDETAPPTYRSLEFSIALVTEPPQARTPSRPLKGHTAPATDSWEICKLQVSETTRPTFLHCRIACIPLFFVSTST